MPAIIVAKASNSQAVDVLAKLVNQPVADSTVVVGKESQWIVVAGAFTYDRRIYITAVDFLHGIVITLFCDNPKSGHFGAHKTTELVSRQFYWTAMDSHVRKYVSGCKVCHQIKVPWQARHGINMPLGTPCQPWEGITMDFITDLVESTALGYARIPLMVDQLTKLAIYIPCGNDIDSPELAWLFLEQVISKRGVPDNIVTDPGTQVTR